MGGCGVVVYGVRVFCCVISFWVLDVRGKWVVMEVVFVVWFVSRFVWLLGWVNGC